MTVQMKKYLLWFAQEHVEFRHAELQSLIELFDVQLTPINAKLDGRRLWIADTSEDAGELPWMVVECAAESDILKICSRSILIKHVNELYAMGDSIEEVGQQLRQKNIEPHTATYKFEVEAYGRRKISREDKVKKMEAFNFLPFRGKVRMKDPEHVYYIMEFYGIENNVFREFPLKVFFGKLVCEGQRELITHLSLKKRQFIANTSMDPTLAIVMSNMAKIKQPDLVFDPFVGSASLLVAAALHGAYVTGMDIDWMLLHGRAKPSRCKVEKREKDECVENNLRQYDLHRKYVDVIIGDSSLPILRHLGFDAIITDPPYGIRESTERIGFKDSKYPIPGHLAEQHVPSKISYSLREVITDLLCFSASSLPIGGRLVFWLPVFREDFLADLQKNNAHPSHPCLLMISCSEQRLTSIASRLLYTFEKTQDLDETECRRQLEALSINPTTHTEPTFRDKYFSKVSTPANN